MGNVLSILGADVAATVSSADCRRAGNVLPIMQLVGHDDSEVTGPAFDPSLTRLYFSSQRGTTGSSASGVTFEISGPFFV